MTKTKVKKIKVKPSLKAKKRSTKKTSQAYGGRPKQSSKTSYDLAREVLSKIDREVNRGRYASRGDAIRHILRKLIESKVPIE